MSKKIAVTGGIGSGKSTVLDILKAEGYPVFSCDEIYKKIIKTQEYVHLVAKYFPLCVVENKIDKTRLSEIVFKDKEKRLLLNSLAHPIIMRDLTAQMDERTEEFVFAEVPLLFEGNYENLFDAIFVVLRNREDRIQSVIERDSTQREQVENRISSQINYEGIDVQEKLKQENVFVLENEKDVAHLIKKVKMLLENIKN